MKSLINIAFSPCPNDTFVFHAWVHGCLPGAPKLEVTYADIDKTNEWAQSDKGTDMMKISYAALPWMSPDYTLIPCGGALGRGCGPLVLTKGENTTVSDLARQKVAVPSERSTAYLLFRLWIASHSLKAKPEIIVLPFDQIMPSIRDGIVDAGLVIHEARFTYPSYGLTLLQDLGSWWEKDTGLPIPLGAIIAKKSLDIEAITHWIQSSLKYAWKHPEASKNYILEHAQEMSMEVAQAHIDLYVNEFTADLGVEGKKAIEALLGRAEEEGLVPKIRRYLVK